jgi:FkbM family methyltransferase
MPSAAGRSPLRTARFFWNIGRQYGIIECASLIGRKMQHYRLNRGQPPGRLVLREGISFQAAPEAAAVFRMFIDLDPDMVREMDGFIALSRGRKRLIDIGAHYGIFSLAFAANGGEKALAVDPNPAAVKVLREHAAKNPSLAIDIEQVALGDRVGSIRMEVDNLHSNAVIEHANRAVMVPQTTVDALSQERGFVPDTLKIDVEGYELSVLEGCGNLLRDVGPLVFLEVHPDHLGRLGRSVVELVQMLEQLQYRFADTEGRPLGDPKTFLERGIQRVVCEKQREP